MIEDQQLWKSEDGEDRNDWSELLAEKRDVGADGQTVG